MVTAGLKQRWINNLWGWLFVFPTVLGILILNVIPIFQTVWQTFFRVGDFGRGNTFIGFANYIRLFSDSEVWQSLRNTLVYVAVEVPFSVAIGFIFAVILNRKIPGRGFFRTLFFLPMVVAPAAVAMVWSYLYNTHFGLLNYFLRNIGLSPVGWISNPDIALYSIAAIGVWSSFGFTMVLFLAGLQGIPKDYYEAAQIDGASFFRQQLMITIPLISPTTYFVVVTRVLTAFQVFDLIFVVLNRQSPVLPSTQSLVFLFYRATFMENNRGYGATIVLLLLIVVIIATAVQQYLQKRWVHYQ